MNVLPPVNLLGSEGLLARRRGLSLNTGLAQRATQRRHRLADIIRRWQRNLFVFVFAVVFLLRSLCLYLSLCLCLSLSLSALVQWAPIGGMCFEPSKVRAVSEKAAPGRDWSAGHWAPHWAATPAFYSLCWDLSLVRPCFEIKCQLLFFFFLFKTKSN